MLNENNELIGKLHYLVKAGAKIQFDTFDEQGNVSATLNVVTAEDICVYLENTQVKLDSIENA